MNIPQLGPLHPDSSIPEWLVSKPVSIPYFDHEDLTFTLEDLTEDDLPDVQKAVAAFLALGPEARLAASPYVFQNYREMVDAVGEDCFECDITKPEDVWAHVYPSEIHVSRRYRCDRLIYLKITASCDWEPEHALQLVYRQGSELSRVSAQDGHLTRTDAYDLPEDQDRII